MGEWERLVWFTQVLHEFGCDVVVTDLSPCPTGPQPAAGGVQPARLSRQRHAYFGRCPETAGCLIACDRMAEVVTQASAARNAHHTRSGVKGISRMRTPVAS